MNNLFKTLTFFNILLNLSEHLLSKFLGLHPPQYFCDFFPIFPLSISILVLDLSLHLPHSTEKPYSLNQFLNLERQ